MKGGLVVCDSIDEATLLGLQEGLQFLIEEANLRENDFVVMCGCKDIVRWIKGEKATACNRRFLRNRTASLISLFSGVMLEHVQEKDFKALRQWKLMANAENGTWCKWFI
ncbi:hypothetical protein PIB30_047255 [Stylosanthes scabra]|uniref:RNase H type-1 domain-containing protein n=1 Tax=Stylosanthes scabra TaxID=79078 RepID=A0ABU6ZFF7_9FABA|nr:hypothetical protein [Stylosanthes scabra]